MSATVFSTVYTYGGGEALDYIFNAVAVLFSSGFMDSLIYISEALSLVFIGFMIAFQPGNFGPYLRWIGSYIFILVVLLQPIQDGKMSVYINDVITGKNYKVDNIPPGLVIPASFLSAVGFGLTMGFEGILSTPASHYLPYYKYGTMFGAYVMSRLRDFKIQDPILRENMENFISNCMAYDVMLGSKYDISTLYASSDIWEIIEKNASPLRMFNYRNQNKGGRELVTCKVGVERMSNVFAGEASLLGLRFPDVVRFSNTGIGDALQLGSAFHGKSAHSPDEQLRQVLIINAFKDVPRSYGASRIAQDQGDLWGLLGGISQMVLPILYVVFQALIYGSFPVIVLFAFFSTRMRVIGTYFKMMLWLELWPLLFAIINLLMSIFAGYSLSSFGGEITIDNINSIVSTQAHYVLAALSLGLLVPILSYMIMRAGVASIMHVASQTSGAVQHNGGAVVHNTVSSDTARSMIVAANNTYGAYSNGVRVDGGVAGEYISDSMRQIMPMEHTLRTFPSTQDHDVGALNSGGIGTRSGVRTSSEIGTVSGSTNSVSGQNIEARTVYHSMNAASMLQDYINVSIRQEEVAVANISREMAEAKQARHGHVLDFMSVHSGGGNFGENRYAEVGVKSDREHVSADSISGANENAKHGSVGGDTVLSAQQTVEDYRVQDAMYGAKPLADADEVMLGIAQNTGFGSIGPYEKQLADSLICADECYKQKHAALSLHTEKLEGLQQLRTRLSNVASSNGMDAYEQFLSYVAARPDPDSQYFTQKLGEQRALNIIKDGGKDRDRYLRDFTELHMSQCVLQKADVAVGANNMVAETGKSMNTKNVSVDPGAIGEIQYHDGDVGEIKDSGTRDSGAVIVSEAEKDGLSGQDEESTGSKIMYQKSSFTDK